MRHALILLTLLALAGPGSQPAPAAPPDRILRVETVAATLVQWERGDYVWARLAVRRRGTIAAMPGPNPIGPFLEAHRGRRVTVEIATVAVILPEAGRTEVRRIVGARSGAGTAAAWWRRLSPYGRRTAMRRFHEAIS